MNAKTDAEGNVNSILVTIYDSFGADVRGPMPRFGTSLQKRVPEIQERQVRRADEFHMRETLYRQMVYCINTYRTWIEVAG